MNFIFAPPCNILYVLSMFLVLQLSSVAIVSSVIVSTASMVSKYCKYRKYLKSVSRKANKKKTCNHLQGFKHVVLNSTCARIFQG